MVAVKIKRHSWIVELNYSSRLPGLQVSSDGGEGSVVRDSTATRLLSTAAILGTDFMAYLTMNPEIKT